MSDAREKSLPPLLAFGAHPDDIEFGAGAVIAREARAGRACHFAVCSRGEAASNGTPAIRTREASEAAKILGATLEFLSLGKGSGDARLEVLPQHAIALAAVIRRVRPGIVLAPTLTENQHPDHAALATLVRTACRLARYGGIKELKTKKLPAHTIDALLFYAITLDAEPQGHCIFVDVSAPGLIDQWTRAMQAHASQMKTRNYLELQLARARLNGLRSGTQYAVALFPNDPLVFDSLNAIGRTARSF